MRCVSAENNGGLHAADIALFMELITFGGFGTPPGLLLLSRPGLFGDKGRMRDDIGPVPDIPLVMSRGRYFQPTREPNSGSVLLPFVCTADLSRLAAHQG